MRKFCKFGLILLIIVIFSSTAVLASDSLKFTKVQTYCNRTYTCVNTHSVSDIFKDDVVALPGSITNLGFVYSFGIYYDKIYYITGARGSSGVLGYIYRCNIDGSENELIADNADALRHPYLSDGCLYYDVLNDYDNFYGRNLCGGIMKINLNTGDYGRIVTDRYSTLVNVLDDKVFYKSSGYHVMNTSGRYIGEMSPYDVEVISDIIIGNTAYIGLDNEIYTLDWNLNSKWIDSAPERVNGCNILPNTCNVENVTGGYIYYLVGFSNPLLHFELAPDEALYRMPVNGGESELVAWWYIS
ncbi:MAG: hypothetical protein Q4E94_03115 [Clostridia bacterium]|nr:hypothetical protein [Clostridia bacterium]